MTQVEIDPGAGFCYGVEKVILAAENSLRNGESLYALGQLVHNSGELKRLEKLGLKTVTHDQLGEIDSGKVLFRAHGEPPSSYRKATDLHVAVMDGTCPIVLRLQKKIRDTYLNMDREKEQLVIFGKQDHPETIGLLGQVAGDAVVVSTPREVERVDRNHRVHLFSQTTMDPGVFRKVEALLMDRTGHVDAEFRSHCTICGQMKRRKPGLETFASRHEVMVFVSGRDSSNGKMLYEFCRSLNPRTFWISGPEEMKADWFKGAGTIGISGATSTSREQLEGVRNRVVEITSS